MGFAANAASHWWIILIIVVLIFGATKLPALARSIGQSVNILKTEVKRDDAGNEVVVTESDGPAATTDRK